MEPPPKPSASLFDVYLRLRPSFIPTAERFLNVETSDGHAPTHITIHPPATDRRKRAIEKFAFTQVFEEQASQLDLFNGTGLGSIIQGVLGQEGREGRDGLLATLGVTGSGKSHTILGSPSQRGLTQLSLDVLFQSIGDQLAQVAYHEAVLPSLCAADNSESQLSPANAFLESIYGDGTANERGHSRGPSRATTPMMDVSFMSTGPSSSKRYLPRLSNLPQFPTVEEVSIDIDSTAEFAVIVSMYEVYNDRIFDLLAGSATKIAALKRRPLLYKSTEQSPDRKVVAGLRKVVCANLDEAMLVLETGLTERKVAGTGSNATSSRSHGFFCVEVKKRHKGVIMGPWSGSTLTVVDLAGSERARTAKTAGTTLAEAGKINESLMYLGQCMQMQSDNADLSRPQNIVPFRQCKLTELLFSNSFPSSNQNHHHHHHHHTRKAPQKAIMIVTADPLGDFNATSQILRYSALAREVTVPRIPSVTSTILAAPAPRSAGPTSGRSTPSAAAATAQEDLEQALRQLAQLRAELDVAQLRLEDETARRRAAESSWAAAEQRAELVEADIRDEVWADMEARLDAEQRRWRAARDRERDAADSHVDAKLDILARSTSAEAAFDVLEDPDPTAQDAIAELRDENERLRARLEAVEREKGLRSPSKKMRVLKPRRWEGSEVGLDGSP
ncbi:hypothetical protein MBLNU459_g2122t3 [Dothideomycetes sp. NU459]